MALIKKAVLYFICCTTVLIGLSACSSEPIVMPDVTGEQVVMPDVTDVNYERATNKLFALGIFNLVAIGEDGSSEVIEEWGNWMVLSQDPKPGTEVNTLEEIVLTVKLIRENGEDEEKTEATGQEAQSTTLKSTLDLLKGKPYRDAYEELTQLGLTAKWIHSGSGQDFTESIRLNIEDPDSEFEVPWIIVDYKDLNEQNKTITMLVNTEENLGSQAAAADANKTLAAKLAAIDAWLAVAQYGDNQYPYGFKLHYIVGVLAETAEDENTWFLKATCDVTNAYGTKTKNMTCEARVIGTNDRPEVIYFVVY
jgi:hypothetical protein